MTRRIVITLLVLTATVSPSHAQFGGLPVFDAANLAQAVLIAQRAQRHLQELEAQYRTITRMARSLGDMDRYRIPAIGLTHHDVGRWEYGRPWLQGLNAGDATGAAYWATTLPLDRPTTIPNRLSASARRAFERQYATVEISDSVATMGGYQVGLIRGYHEMTAILDKVAAGELIGRRQDMAANQLLSHALEQLLARSKRMRDTEAATLNMQLVTWRDGRGANEAFAAGTGDALRTWRQP